MESSFVLFILLLVSFVMVGFSQTNFFARHSWTDLKNPVNLVLFQAPSHSYSEHLPTEQIKKPWNIKSTIPAYRKVFYEEDVPMNDRRWIIMSHGNAEDLMQCHPQVERMSKDLLADVIVWDYSGYGLNPLNEYERTPEGMNKSLEAVYHHMIKLGYHYKHAILWGYSLGTGPTTAFAAKLNQTENTHIAGVVLQSPYTSIEGVYKHITPSIVSSWITIDKRWDSEANISQIKDPVLILHGQRDGMIPISHGSKLNDVCSQAKFVVFPHTGHTNFDYTLVTKEVQKWIKLFVDEKLRKEEEEKLKEKWEKDQSSNKK